MNKPVYRHLYVQVLVAIACGVLLGHFYPAVGSRFQPLAEGFIKLIKMMIAPIIFCTVVTGIAGVSDMKKVGRVGGKALFYFEIVSTFALVIGLIVVNIIKPGAGMNVNASLLDTSSITGYTESAKSQSTMQFILNMIPTTFVDAFAKGEMLQVLLLSVLLGFAFASAGDRAKSALNFLEECLNALFIAVGYIMKLAPIGAFGAMAFVIGRYGLQSLIPLAKLLGSVYLTSLLFVFVVLGLIARLAGFSIGKFILYIKEELLIVLGTSSSESALPGIMSKLQKLGCSKSVTGLVIPTGYSFNLDGTSIYLTMAAIFIAQATNTELTLMQQITLLVVLLLTSKGAAAVTGSGFITLAATLSVVPTVPVAGLALIVGIDRFMSEIRALTNLVGNGVATLVISKWEGELDIQQLNSQLAVDSDLATTAGQTVSR
ncbi:MAG: dicarboxylate/amino acid:cation symporter [Steroidobacter sp.]